MTVRIPIEELDKYGFADPAGSKGRIKKVRARQALVMVGADWLGRLFALETWTGRLPTSEYRDRLLTMYEKWQPRVFGIEANAMQVLFGDLVREEAKRRWGTVRIRAITQPTRVDKDFRIRQKMEPVISDGRLFVQEKQVELISEISGFPTAHYKDLIDALASAASLVPRRAARRGRDDEIDNLAEYLRKTGVPAREIERRVEEVRRSVELR